MKNGRQIDSIRDIQDAGLRQNTIFKQNLLKIAGNLKLEQLNNILKFRPAPRTDSRVIFAHEGCRTCGVIG